MGSFDSVMLGLIYGWRQGKKDKPSRAEAVRRIVEEVVAPRRARSMRPKVD
jgi:hypothetical protein